MSYVGAPYNFVPFGEKIYRKDKEGLTKHNEITGLSGYLEYQVTAHTPILIDGGNKHFYENKDGKAAIPGSTMRGLVRSNMQILSQSSVVDDIGNARLMYRSVGTAKKDQNKEAYSEVFAPGIGTDENGKSFSYLKNVKGGYITCENGKYYIIPSVVDKFRKNSEEESWGEWNYYRLNEFWIFKKKYKGFEMLNNPCTLQNITFEEAGETEKEDGSKEIIYVGIKNKDYCPHFEPLYYHLKGIKNIDALSEKPVDGYEKGTLITTGFMNKKRAFYVIPDMVNVTKDKWIRISDAEADSFKRDYEGRKNQFSAAVGGGIDRISREKLIKKAKRFFDLPQEGEIKPVFYVYVTSESNNGKEQKGQWCFGFTPHLRLFYDKEIHDGLSAEQRDNSLDYCKSLFGFTTDKESYRSRLSFRDAVIDDKTISENGGRSVTLGEPKPTSYLDYLKGTDEKAATYRGDFSLRGMKQYWLHEKPVNTDIGYKKNVSSDIYPYPEGSSFTGRIRFTNLSEEELGMLLWSLLLEKDSQQNIGKGKPYGYGRISISLKNLNIMNPDALYNSDSLCLNPYEDQSDRYYGYIGKAKQSMTKFIGDDVMRYAPIYNFLRMKSARKFPDEDRIRYMSIQNHEYQNRWKMLPTIEDILDKKSKRDTPSYSQNRSGKGNDNYRGGNHFNQNGHYGNNRNDRNQKFGNRTRDGQKRDRRDNYN